MTTTTPNQTATILATVADSEGLHPMDVARFADLLAPFDLTPADVTPADITTASTMARSEMAAIRQRVNVLNGGQASDPVLSSTRRARPTATPTLAPKRKKTGKRAKIFGYAVTAVIRWCGANGWNLEDTALACLTLSGKDVSDVTLKLQLKAGAVGPENNWNKRGAPADLTKAEIRQLKAAVL